MGNRVIKKFGIYNISGAGLVAAIQATPVAASGLFFIPMANGREILFYAIE